MGTVPHCVKRKVSCSGTFFGYIAAMNLTNNYRALILSALRKNGITQTHLAKEMGYGKTWVTKLLNGTLKAVSDDDADKLEAVLGIRFVQFVEPNVSVSSLAIEVDEAIKRSDQFSRIVRELLPLVKEAPMVPRYVEASDMNRLGREIIAIVTDNPDKAGKVAREVLKLLSE
jgi:transcriptional regulator with XRE-family HTH domain